MVRHGEAMEQNRGTPGTIDQFIGHFAAFVVTPAIESSVFSQASNFPQSQCRKFAKDPETA